MIYYHFLSAEALFNTDKDSYLIYCLKGFVETEKTACSEITYEEIKEMDIFQGFPESVKDGSTRFVREEGQIIMQNILTSVIT
jgi:hypothetical protein